MEKKKAIYLIYNINFWIYLFFMVFVAWENGFQSLSVGDVDMSQIGNQGHSTQLSKRGNSILSGFSKSYLFTHVVRSDII